MKFPDDAYPHRHNHRLFPRLLTEALSTEFTMVVNPNRDLLERLLMSERTIRTHRCELRSGRIACDQRPQPYDLEIVRAILDAWTHRISDRYLDFFVIRQLMQRGPMPANQRDAYELIRGQGDTGAVRFVSRSLTARPARGGLPTFGDSIAPNHNYNTVYSALLVWDVIHCMGLVDMLSQQQRRMGVADGGDRIFNPWERAAMVWTQRAQREPSTIYRRLAP